MKKASVALMAGMLAVTGIVTAGAARKKTVIRL